MQNSNRLFLKIIILLTCSIHARVTFAIDTLLLGQDQATLRLNHPFVLKSTLNLYQDGQWIAVEKVNEIEGIIFFHEKGVHPGEIIVSYDYLTDGLPLSVGPRWRSFPILDLDQEKKQLIPTKQLIRTPDQGSNIFSSGSIYRQLTVSPMGGSDFSGGLQMQLNGQLAKNLRVSGVLSDQDLPIQPEGTTRELDEIDKVYLTVTHPNYSVNAGDIVFNKHIDKTHNINRKLVGLKNTFKYNGWEGTGVYAGTKGKFSSIEIKGRDGDQGPYQLTGKDGNRNIIVLSGTEKVWIDGRELTRGLNHDYTIDYSLAEINFTPNLLIHSDTDIFIEYQYSDFQYQKGFTGGMVAKVFESNGFISMGLFRESDQFQQDDWSKDIWDGLSDSESGKIIIFNSFIREDGDYVFVDSVFVYDPEFLSNDSTRFAITFGFDPNGAYKRLISDKGRIFYEYVPESEREPNLDLYSTYQTIHSPESHQFGFIGGEYKLGKNVTFSGQLNQSGLDPNSINQTNTLHKGASHKFGISVDSLELGPVLWNLSLSDWNRNNAYQSLGQENDVMQRRFWNLDSLLERGVRQSNLTSEMVVNGIGSSQFEYANLTYAQNERSRVRLNQRMTKPILKDSYFNYLSVSQVQGNFVRSQGRLQINTKSISPFISYLKELDSEKTQFNNSGGGVSVKVKDIAFESGMDLRKDELYGDAQSWETVSQDFIGYFNLRSRTARGWKQDIVFKKRVKSVETDGSTFDYSLARISLSYRQPQKPVSWELKAKTEESFSEERAVVYDSVGVGLGQFRYEPIFNTYISDPNGAYIAYTVPTGKRNPNTVFEGSQKFTVDLGKLNGFPNLLVRSNTRIDFRGIKTGISQIISPDIGDTSLTRSRLDSRLELLYSGRKRIMGWIDYSQSLNGMDPRGNNLDRLSELGLDFNQSVSKTVSFKTKTKYRKKFVESTVSDLRNRELKGWWNETQFLLKMSNSYDVDIGFVGGSDHGVQQGTSFFSRAYGLKLDGRFFFQKKGRLQTGVSWTTVKEEHGMTHIPPEALNGNPVGVSLRSNTRLQYYLNQSVSLIFTLNTINDDRYKNFITFQGEVRAHF